MQLLFYRLAISFLRHGIHHDWKDTIFGVHVSPGSTETLVRRGGTTNYRLIAYCLSNISAKIVKIGWSASKLQCATSVSFFETHSIYKVYFFTRKWRQRKYNANKHMSDCPSLKISNRASVRLFHFVSSISDLKIRISLHTYNVLASNNKLD